MTDSSNCTCSPAEKLAERQRYIQDIRQDLLSGKRQSDGLRRLYVELLDGGDVWADRLGRVAEIDNREGFLAGLVELLLVLAFEEWPPDPEGFVSHEDKTMDPETA